MKAALSTALDVSSTKVTAVEKETAPTNAADDSGSPKTSATEIEITVTQRMAKILSTLSGQARQHLRLSELLGLSVAECCSTDKAGLVEG